MISSSYTLVSRQSSIISDSDASCILKTCVAIWNLKSPNSEYQLDKKGYSVFLIDKGSEEVFLGWDKAQSVWYSQYKLKSWKFHDFLSKFPLLSQDELLKIKLKERTTVRQCQDFAQKLFKKELCFAPPHFAILNNPDTPLPPRASSSAGKNISSPNMESLPVLLTHLLELNRGLFLGNGHSDLQAGLTEILFDLLNPLYDAGVRHFYDETPACLTYDAYERFNLNPDDTGELLEKTLRELGSLYVSEKLKIFREAKRLGIQVWPIDSKLFTDNLEKRLRIGDGTMVYNIDYFSSKLKKKFICLLGAGHYRVAKELGIPNIRLISQEPETAALEPAPDDIELSKKLLSTLLEKSMKGASLSIEKEMADLLPNVRINEANKKLYQQLSQEQLEEMDSAPDFIATFDRSKKVVIQFS